MRRAGSAALLVLLMVPALIVVIGARSTSAAQTVAGFGSGLKTGTVPSTYVALVKAAGSQCAAGLPSIIAAQIEQESAWNADVVSPAGAEEISQHLSTTWPSWFSHGQSPFDPAAAIPAQARYACAITFELGADREHGMFASDLTITELMLAGYNVGQAAVESAGKISQNGQIPNYVQSIIAQSAYFFDATGVVTGDSFAAEEVAAALSMIATPYVRDGGSYTGPTMGGFDCFGLVLFATFQASNGAILLPHNADLQTRRGSPVSIGPMVRGDLIGFTSPETAAAHHVGIYLGDLELS